LTDLLAVPVTRTTMIVAAVFVIDSLTPLGIAAGALYVAAVLSAVPLRHLHATFITAGICSLLILAGWFVSPRQGDTEWWIILVNRALDLGVIWVAAGMADVWRRMQRRRSKEVLESRLLHQATALSASQQSLRDALGASLKSLCDIVNVPAGHVYFRDGAGQYLVASDIWYTSPHAALEPLRLASRGLRFAQYEGAVGRAWKAGGPLTVASVAASPDYAWLPDPARLGIASAFLLPVTMGGNVVAIMEFFSGQPVEIDAEFRALACNVGEQLGRLFERRKAEQTIRRSEERLRLALQGGGMGTWEWYLDGGSVTWSPELEQIHGLAPGTFAGTLEAMLREVHPEDRVRVAEAFQQLREVGGEYRLEYRVVRPDGSVQWLEGRGAVYADADGSPRRLSGVCLNITQRKQIEEQNARLAAVVQSSDDAILAKTLDGTILSWNCGAERIYGYSADEIIGKPVSILVPEDRRNDFADIMTQIARGQRVDHYETVRQRKDGQVIDISLTVSPIVDSEGVIVGASSVAKDISDRKKAEREMQEARAKAEAVSRLQSRFLANMSHELRTPMNSILGMLQLALHEELPPAIYGALLTARSSADALLALLNDLLDYSRIEAGKLSIHPAPIRLRDVVDEAVRTLAPKACEKGLELLYDVDEAVPDRLLGDALRIRQVLVNLIANAIKFTAVGDVTVSVTSGKVGPDVAEVRLAVTDTGEGISLADQQQIFEPFMQSDASAARQHGGAGLGLSICRELVRCMGGTLGLQSTLGRGSCFWFQLPLARDGDNSTPEDAGTAPSDAALGGLTALVVERHAATRQTLQSMLQRLTLVVDVAVDADHLIGRLLRAETEGHPYRLVIVDLATVGGSAAALRERLAAALREVPPAIFLAYAGSEGSDQERDAAGIVPRVAWLEKPIAPALLRQAVRQVLELAPPAATARPGAWLSEAAPRPLSILLAEDIPANQEVVTSVLCRRGHRVTVAANGAEAIAAVEQAAFDVILMDVTMPVVDGYEATTAIRQREQARQQRTPIIALTAHATQSDREMCRAAGMDAYLSKPLDVCQLVELVESSAQRPASAQLGAPAATTHLARSQRPTLAQSDLADADALTSAAADSAADTAVIDYRGAMQRLGGDTELFRELVRMVSEDAPGLVEVMWQCLDTADAAELLRAAHSLKGLAANFGASEVVDRARRLEGIAQSPSLGAARPVVDELQREVTRLLDALAPYL